MLDTVISIFKTVKLINDPFNRNINFIVDRIRTGNPKTKERIKQIRKLALDPDKTKETKAVKLTLPNFTFSGTFTKRAYEDGQESNLVNYSGIVLLDFDKVSNMEQLKKELCSDPFTAICFKSVSGLGYKVLVQTNNTDHKLHKNYVDELINYYSKYAPLDDSGSRIAQGTYESYDPEIYVNPTFEIWTVKAEQLNTYYTGKKEFNDTRPFSLVITDEYSLFKSAMEYRNKYDSFRKGNRNNYVYHLGVTCLKYGISKNYAIQMAINEFSEKDFNSSDISGAIESAYKRTWLKGTFQVRDKSKYDIIRQAKKEDKPRPDIIKLVKIESEKENKPLSDDQIIQAIQEVESETEGTYQTFWDTFQKDPDKPESPFIVKFNYTKWFQWNKKQGVFLYYPAGDRSGDYMFIRVQNNIVMPLEKTYFPRVIKDHLETLPQIVDNVSRDTLLNTFTHDIDSITSKRKLEMFAEVPLNFIQDTKDDIHFYFKDAILKVTAENMELIGYGQITGSCVWDKKRIKQPLLDLTDEKRNLESFLKMGKDNFAFGNWIYETCDRDIDAAKSLCAVLGYLMHGYKDTSNPRAVIFLERPIAGNPEGGTGKGILIQALQQMRNVIRENGKIANPKDKFWAQSIKLDTDIFCIEDVQKNFNFEDIFSVITDGITVEDKYKSKFYIPYERSPKIAITTNYPIRGSGSSHERRKYEIELTHTFKEKHGDPISYYGKRFFSADWDDADWQLFYYFMFECAQYYLRIKGRIVIHPSDSLLLNKFLGSTMYEWGAYAAEHIIPGEYYAKGEIHEDYVNHLKERGSAKINISVQRVTAYVKEYARYLGCEIIEETKGKRRCFKLEHPDGIRKTDHKLYLLRNESGLETENIDGYGEDNSDSTYFDNTVSHADGLPF